MREPTPRQGPVPRLFDSLTEDQYGEFRGQGITVKLASGSYLFQQGDPVDRFYAVTRGRLKLFKLNEEGREVIIRYIEPGEITAAITVLKDAVYPVTAEAVGETAVLAWTKTSLSALMRANSDIAIKLLNIAFERLNDIQQRYLELCTEQVDQRIARTLLRLMQGAGKKTDGGIEIDIPLTRQNIADYSGTTLHTVSRTLSAWDKNGWVKSGRRRITITNPHELVMFTEGSAESRFS